MSSKSIPARLRSPLVVALLASFGSRSLLGWLVALPVVGAVSASGVGALPQGDRALFEAPGFWLIELLLRDYRALGAAVRVGMVLWLAALCLRVLPSALLFAVAANPQAPLAESARRSLAAARRFLALGIAELLSLLLLLVLASAGLGLAQAARTENEARAALGPLAATLLGSLLLGACGVFFDCCRRATLDSGLRDSTRSAARLLRERGAPLAAGYLLFFGAGTLAVATAARAVEALDLSQPGALRVTAVFLVHQGTVLALCALEALWIARLSAEP
jgi:hypothetical protein